jgi:hypothetical protein
MTAYTICVVVHLVGVAGLFVALGIEGAGLFCLGRASTRGEVRNALGALGLNRRVGPPSILTALASGFYMARVWGWVPWMGTSLGLMVIVVGIGAAVTGRRTSRLQREMGAAEEIPLPTHEPALATSFAARSLLLAAILVLMVTKAGLAGCLSVAATAVSVALLLLLRPKPAGPQPHA